MTSSTRASARASRLAALAALLVFAVGLVVAAPAQAAAYRFWSYWQSPSGTWTFSQAGPSAVLPADGTVEGWRFGITTEGGSADAAPRVEPSFDALCGQTAPVAGSKRVGLVVDFGDAAEAPDGETPPAAIATCALVPEDANGYAVLRSVAQVRTESGMVCGIAGYPTGECAVVVDDPLPAASAAADTSQSDTGQIDTNQIDTSEFGMATEEPADSGASPVGLVVSVVVVAFIIVLAAAARRRSS